MKNIKFLTLFHQLEKQEVSAFGKYLKATHRRNRIALQVYEKARQGHPDSPLQKKLHWERLAFKIFPPETGSKQTPRKKLLNTFSDLFQYLRAFLVAQKANDKSIESELLWLRILEEKKMKVQQKKELRELCGDIIGKKKAKVADYLHHFVASYFIYENEEKVTKKNLTDIHLSLETFYRLYRQKLDCEILNWQKQDSIENVNFNDAKPDSPLFQLYENVYHLIADGEDEQYEALYSELKKLASKISQAERLHIWRYLKNHCAKKIRDGEIEYFKAAHKLDKFALEQGFFLEGGLMSAGQFLNIISVAGAIKEIEWAEGFKKKYLQFLKEKIRAECQVVAEAILLIKQGRFGAAKKKLEQLENYQSDDLSLAINHRLYELIALFELGVNDDDILFKKITNFQRYLERNAGPQAKASKATKNFLMFFYHLVWQKKSKEWLKAEIQAATLLYMREWLLEKVALYKA